MITVNNTDYLIAKLRNCYERTDDQRRSDRLEAADLIESLSSECATLRQALEGMVESYGEYACSSVDDAVDALRGNK